jgi:hypothetical protein
MHMHTRDMTGNTRPSCLCGDAQGTLRIGFTRVLADWFHQGTCRLVSPGYLRIGFTRVLADCFHQGTCRLVSPGYLQIGFTRVLADWFHQGTCRLVSPGYLQIGFTRVLADWFHHGTCKYARKSTELIKHLRLSWPGRKESQPDFPFKGKRFGKI